MSCFFRFSPPYRIGVVRFLSKCLLLFSSTPSSKKRLRYWRFQNPRFFSTTRFFGAKNDCHCRILTKKHSFFNFFTENVDSAKNNAEFSILHKDSHEKSHFFIDFDEKRNGFSCFCRLREHCPPVMEACVAENVLQHDTCQNFRLRRATN